MFRQLFIVITVLFVSLSACTVAPDVEVSMEPSVNINEAIKDELQPILHAMLSGMIDEQIAVIQYTNTACATVAGLGGPPPCLDGIPEGTLVDVLPVLGSEGSFVTPEEMESFLNNSIVKSLYAVYRVTPNPNIEPYYPEGEYAMLFEREDISSPVVLQVLDGKVVRMDFRMGLAAEDILKEIPMEQVIVTLQDAHGWMEAVR